MLDTFGCSGCSSCKLIPIRTGSDPGQCRSAVLRSLFGAFSTRRLIKQREIMGERGLATHPLVDADVAQKANVLDESGKLESLA